MELRQFPDASPYPSQCEVSPLPVLEERLQEIVDLLKADRSRSGDAPQAVPVKEESVIERYFQLREGIYQAIQVLESTKGSFRSKTLGDLRHSLEDLLKKTSPDSRDSFH